MDPKLFMSAPMAMAGNQLSRFLLKILRAGLHNFGLIIGGVELWVLFQSSFLRGQM
jgi:hypothetical protein